MKFLALALFAILALAACSQESPLPDSQSVAQSRLNVAFTCSREADRLSALDPDADAVFRYGRYLHTRDGPKDFNEVARYYRIAAAHGHYKANHNVQQLVASGFADSPGAAYEAVEWATRLVEQGIPTGYYDIGYYLKSGYGLKQDPEMALKYIRKAADLGNADAQYYISDLLSRYDRQSNVWREMLRCATDQGHERAAYELGVYLKVRKDFQESLAAYQKGVESGSSISASNLRKAFLDQPEARELYSLNVSKDEERARRYEKIKSFLDENEISNPKVPDIDKIVPLPPAQLPPWDGTFEWEKAHARIPPKPSDELIERLAKEKNLDPSTGLPLTQQQIGAGENKLSLSTTTRALEACPQTGVWRACPPAGYVAKSAERAFRKGDELPLLHVEQRRRIALLDSVLGTRRMHTDGVWNLISFGDDA
ncbi:sel1 repeat family protein [Caballeronia sp. EK]|uniref:SEL1-like repeat protein n=1 Tax=Caballeronia sp. EK TaxID=2767469 RepID=UPI0016568070|nr:sel1 repeat family protein [Caballeronia sp. EK]MBC8639889.1 sel1 repeat family protein [Caballeronia sp. EK]